MSIGVPTQNASTLDFVSPSSHVGGRLVGFRAAHSGLDGSVRAIVDRRPLVELSRAGSESEGWRPAEWWGLSTQSSATISQRA